MSQNNEGWGAHILDYFILCSTVWLLLFFIHLKLELIFQIDHLIVEKKLYLSTLYQIIQLTQHSARPILAQRLVSDVR